MSDSVSSWNPFGRLEYNIEREYTFSDGNTPLWLNANKHGLSSLRSNNGYLRFSVQRQMDADSLRQWALGYGIDVALAHHFTSTVVLQQAYVDVRWKRGLLTIGCKELPMELRNNRLSSGSQTLGVNARPVPQVRIALPDYLSLVRGGWLALKGHLAYGRMTDDRWQRNTTQQLANYAEGVLFHSKAGYLRIGKEGRPLTVEMGLEMACMFGGTAHNTIEGWKDYPGDSSIKGFWNAFVPGGQEVHEGVYGNVSGNHVGSWLLRVNYDKPLWGISLYADKFFEDHSGMFFLDYDGYGHGDEWQEWKDRRWFVYDVKDGMLGVELRLPSCRWVSGAVVEYMHTKYQSGPINHDHSTGIPDHIAGRDDYYNHFIYPGWQHWGQVMGNPLYRSPLYNTDGTLLVENNRFEAFHLGVEGQPWPRFRYRLLFSWQDGLGTYDSPYLKKHYNRSCLVETAYQLRPRWAVRLAFGMDHGWLLGNNNGLQITLTRRGWLMK